MANLEITNETPVSFLTVGQLKTLLSLNEKPATNDPENHSDTAKEYIFGIAGLAKLLNCSKPTAQTLKSSGRITFSQSGRKIVFEKAQILRELQNK